MTRRHRETRLARVLAKLLDEPRQRTAVLAGPDAVRTQLLADRRDRVDQLGQRLRRFGIGSDERLQSPLGNVPPGGDPVVPRGQLRRDGQPRAEAEYARSGRWIDGADRKD